MTQAEREKRAAGEAAAALVEDGMRVGLGTGSTLAHFLPALASRRLSVRCVATSPRTEQAARARSAFVSTTSEGSTGSIWPSTERIRSRRRAGS